MIKRVGIIAQGVAAARDDEDTKEILHQTRTSTSAFSSIYEMVPNGLNRAHLLRK